MRFLIASLMLVCTMSFAGCSYGEGRCSSYSAEEFDQVESEVETLWPGPGELDLTNIKLLCTDDLEDLSYRDDGNLNGVTYSYSRDGQRYHDVIIEKHLFLRTTSYVHELVHVSLDNTEGNADRDHADGDGPWSDEHDAMIEAIRGF